MFTCDRGTQEQSGDVMKLAAFDGYPKPRAAAVVKLASFRSASTWPKGPCKFDSITAWRSAFIRGEGGGYVALLEVTPQICEAHC
jgi:hypothetical protein